MVMLRSLAFQSLTTSVLDFLAAHGVATVEDFVLHELHKLSALAEQSCVSADVKQAVLELLSYFDESYGSWSNGFELCQRATYQIALGCESIDNLLQGGLREGTLTELVGPSSTGKTQAAACAANQLHGPVIYIDTCGSFSSRRVARMLGGILASHHYVEEKREEMSLALSNIQRVALFNIFSTLNFLQELLQSLQAGGEKSRPRLLVLDSVSSVISPVLGGNHSQGHALMISLSQILKKLVTIHRTVVLLTNHTVAGEGGQTKPALGGSWKSVPNNRLMLNHHHPGAEVYRMTITKHTSVPCNNNALYRISNAGVESC